MRYDMFVHPVGATTKEKSVHVFEKMESSIYSEKWTVPHLKKYLRDRGIPFSNYTKRDLQEMVLRCFVLNNHDS